MTDAKLHAPFIDLVHQLNRLKLRVANTPVYRLAVCSEVNTDGTIDATVPGLDDNYEQIMFPIAGIRVVGNDFPIAGDTIFIVSTDKGYVSLGKQNSDATNSAGEGGGVTIAYRHVQSSASTTWTITHGLLFKPNVSVVDSGGTVIYPGTVTYTSTQIVLTFSAAIGGEAYLS